MKKKLNLEDILSNEEKFSKDQGKLFNGRDVNRRTRTLGKILISLLESQKNNNVTNPNELYSRIERQLYRKRMFARLRIASAASILVAAMLTIYLITSYNMPEGVAELPMSDTLKYTTIISHDDQMVIKEKVSTLHVTSSGKLQVAGDEAFKGDKQDNKTYEQESQDKAAQKANDKVGQLKTILVPYGNKVTLVLADSTKVILNAGSQLTFPSQFAGNTREVKLIGEAFFDVTENTSQPFIVQTNQVNVRVLGTKFNISAYADDQQVTTVLTQGKVNVSNRDLKQSTILAPGQMAAYSKQDKLITKSKVNTDIYTSWTQGYLIVEKESLPGLLKRIGRYYNVTFIVENNELEKQFYHGEVILQNDIVDILRLIAKTIPITYEKKGNKIWIK
ncbi:DUF4974 domain-containing protein [Puteibacter caeruleilacunae]|nr:DUF4974 domain-containing protein [Puteibacter caeruleilacunae]